jgi:lysyl-tRNA synthetase class 2
MMKQKTWQKIKNDKTLLSPYLVRQTVVDTIRSFFKKQDFREVMTPILVPIPSAESNLEVFETQLKTSRGESRRGFLIMSPEYSLKKLLAAGIGNVFEITKCFRNEEEVSVQHNPEFTMLEWYRTGVNYKAIMTDFEQLFVELIRETQPQSELKQWVYQGKSYDISLPWPRYSVAECFMQFAGIDTEVLLDKAQFLDTASKKGYQIDAATTWEQVFYQIFFNEIEPALLATGRPAFVYDYPLSQAALARECAADPRFAERFEVYVAGLELGNCFSELLDGDEQARRFQEDLRLRSMGGKTEYPMDTELIEALQSGLPEVAGIAVGVDRLAMLAADVPTIADTLFFPGHELFDLPLAGE